MNMLDSSEFPTPILFIIFNNLHVSKKTFEKIKKIKPAHLYISADGPRLSRLGEDLLCLEARELIDEIDWPCNLKTFFRDENSGSAGIGVSSAIKWFFNEVEEGIVLEYDTVPHIDFFYYCHELLVKYRDSKSVGIISGNNLLGSRMGGDNCSYHLSALPTLWGFATWRRFIDEVDFDLKNTHIDAFKKSIPYSNEPGFSRYWAWKFFCVSKNRIHTWDYQILFALWRNGSWAIVPQVNLVSHYVDGFSGAENFNTHIQGITNVPTSPIIPLIHKILHGVDFESDKILIKKFKLKISNYQLLKAYISEFILPIWIKDSRKFLNIKNFIKNIKMY